MDPINSFINLWILVILTYSTVSLVDHLIRYRKYPFKLRVIWWLIFLGLRTNKLSEEAHRIYNSHRHEWFYHDDFHRECKCGEKQFINYADSFPTWRNVESYRVDWHFDPISEVINNG